MIYFVQDSLTYRIKIGYTGKEDPTERVAQLQTGNSSRLCLLTTRPGTEADEQQLHDRFMACHVQDEWFNPAPDLIRYILFCAAASLARDAVSRAAQDIHDEQYPPIRPEPPVTASRRKRAADWLIGKFRQQRTWFSEALLRMASEEGISRNALFEAKDDLGLPPPRRKLLEDRSVRWIWYVPEDWPSLAGGQP